MKNKVILAIIVFIILILGIIFGNSYVQALSRKERLQVNREKGMNTNCYNYCEQYDNCPIYQQNGNCQRRNNQYSHENYHCSKDYNRGRCHR